MTKVKDTTKRIVDTKLLATAQRWLETAAALLYDNQQAAERCTVTAGELSQLVARGAQPDVPENHSDVFAIFDAAQKLHAAGQSVPVIPGVRYVEALDVFLFGEETITGGHLGAALEQALVNAVATCKVMGVTASRLDKADSAVRYARFTRNFNIELAIQEAK